MNIFILGKNVADNVSICDLGVLGGFVPVDIKQVLVHCMSPSPWKSRLSPFDISCYILVFYIHILSAGIIGPFPFLV